MGGSAVDGAVQQKDCFTLSLYESANQLTQGGGLVYRLSDRDCVFFPPAV